MNLVQAEKIIWANILAGNASFVESDPGIGKSEVTLGMAFRYRDHIQKLIPGARVGLSVAFMPPASPISATGLPWKSAKTWTNPVTGLPVEYTFTDPAIPQWAMAVDLDTGELRPADLFDAVMLILEEFGQGPLDAKRAFSEVLLKGQTPTHRLPTLNARVALSNFDKRDGVTNTFDFLINRVNVLRVQGDVDIWVNNFADKSYRHQGRMWSVTPATKVWALRNPAIACEPKPEKQGPWCTFRSLTAQDRFVQTMTEANDGVTPLDAPEFIEGCAGYCGMSQTQSYITTLRFRTDIPTYEAVVADPMGVEIPKKVDQQMLLAFELAGRVQPDTIEPVIQLMSRPNGMPKDMAITFAKSAMRRDPMLLKQPAMIGWTAKNATLLAAIGSLSG